MIDSMNWSKNKLRIVSFDIIRSQLALALGNEDLHGLVEQHKAQLLAHSHRPWQCEAIVVATLQICQILQTNTVYDCRLTCIRLHRHDIMKYGQTDDAFARTPNVDDSIQFKAFVFVVDVGCGLSLHRRALIFLDGVIEMGVWAAAFAFAHVEYWSNETSPGFLFGYHLNKRHTKKLKWRYVFSPRIESKLTATYLSFYGQHVRYTRVNQ